MWFKLLFQGLYYPGGPGFVHGFALTLLRVGFTMTSLFFDP